VCPCAQKLELQGVSEDGFTVQLNTTFISGTPTTLKYGFKDYPALVDDFIDLKILPADCNRPKIVPLMDKALTPYVKGGGAKKYEEELKKIYGFDESGAVGGFQAMTTDMLTVSEGKEGG
jgi:hypothetical protein